MVKQSCCCRGLATLVFMAWKCPCALLRLFAQHSDVTVEYTLRPYCRLYGRPLILTVARPEHVTAAQRKRERETPATTGAVSIPAEPRRWNTGHLQSSITGKGPVFPARLLPAHSKTEWRTKRLPFRGNSPKTPWRRSGCRVKMAFPKNTFLKERVRITTWRQLLALARTAVSPVAYCVTNNEFTCLRFVRICEYAVGPTVAQI